MKTLIRVENANCPDCLNAIQEILMARSLVQSVHVHAADSIDLGGESPCLAHLLDDSNPVQ